MINSPNKINTDAVLDDRLMAYILGPKMISFKEGEETFGEGNFKKYCLNAWRDLWYGGKKEYVSETDKGPLTIRFKKYAERDYAGRLTINLSCTVYKLNGKEITYNDAAGLFGKDAVDEMSLLAWKDLEEDKDKIFKKETEHGLFEIARDRRMNYVQCMILTEATDVFLSDEMDDILKKYL